MSLDVSLYGNTCTKCGHETDEENELYCANITHNLGSMAEAAGIYKHLWRPEEINISQAKDLIKPLKKGLQKLKSDPKKFKEFDSSNNWGTYDQFIPWIEEYLQACIKNPNAKIFISK